MKSDKKYLVSLIVLVSIMSTVTLWERSRAETRLSVLSVSAETGTTEDRVNVQFRVNSPASDFTIIVLPDTQHYSDEYPEIYKNQTEWIAKNKEALNIVFVSHVGDIVQNNDEDEAEWQVADEAMSMLDGVIPYGVLPGNHDMQPGGAANFYEQYFSASRFDKYSWWGGSFDDNRYNYQLFSAGGDDYLILHIQYCPTHAAISWANDVLAQFPERKAIVTTHSYLLTDGSYVKNCQDKSDGEINGLQMWNRLIKRNPNVFMVLAGHIPGFGRRDDFEERIVYQLLSDYQDFPLGGSGYLRIMTFEPRNDIIRVSTYSPYLDKYLEEEGNQFDLAFDMAGDSPPQGKVLVYSGTHYCIATVAAGSCDLATEVDKPIRAVYLGDMGHRGSISTAVPSHAR